MFSYEKTNKVVRDKLYHAGYTDISRIRNIDGVNHMKVTEDSGKSLRVIALSPMGDDMPLDETDSDELVESIINLRRTVLAKEAEKPIVLFVYIDKFVTTEEIHEANDYFEKTFVVFHNDETFEEEFDV